MDDDSYQAFQSHLLNHPKAGKFLSGSKCLRKIRWKSQDGGKRGGTRHIYYFLDDSGTFFMLYAYGRNEQEDISSKEAKSLMS